MKNLNHNNGYILLEALLSILILSIGIIAALMVIQKSVQITQYQKHFLNPARELAELLLSEVELGLMDYKTDNQVILTREREKFQYKISKSDWLMTPDLQEVSVNIIWIDRGKKGSITLTTLLPLESKEGKHKSGS